MQEIDCYTDASYAKDVGGSYIGYIIGNDPIHLEFLEGIKNTEAELIAATNCIETVMATYPNVIINLYTDCQASFSDENKYYALAQGCPYPVRWFKVRGHMKKSSMNDKQLKFREVDIATRKALRQKRKEMV